MLVQAMYNIRTVGGVLVSHSTGVWLRSHTVCTLVILFRLFMIDLQE